MRTPSGPAQPSVASLRLQRCVFIGRRQLRGPALEELGHRVRTQRKLRHLTQEEIARSLGLSASYLSLIERGGRNPSFTTLVEIALALNVKACDLFPVR
jgi:DNA-binding XRE family transcriptional regulator